MGLEFSVGQFAAAAWRYWRNPRRYLPGPGDAAAGYVVRTAEPLRAGDAGARAPSDARSCCGTSEPQPGRRCARRASCARVEAIDREGLLVTSEGALVRYLRAAPKNPLVMSATEREQVGHAFGQLAGRLAAGQSLQFYVEAQPVQLEALLERSRAEAERALRRLTGDAKRRRRCGGCMARCASRWSATPTRRRRSRSPTTSSFPYLPDQRPRLDWSQLLGRRPAALGGRGAGALAGVAPAGGARVAARNRRDPRRSRGAGPLDPPAVRSRRCSTCCGGASTPPPRTARRSVARARASSASRSSASSTRVGDAREAARAALALRELVAGSAIDCADQRHLQRRPRPRAGALRRRRAGRDRVRLAAGRDAVCNARSRCRCTCTPWIGCASARASGRATGGCSASTAATSCAAAPPTTRCSPRRKSSASCSRSSPATSARRRSRSRSTSRSANAALTPTRSGSPRRSSRPSREITAASDARVNTGQLRQLELWQSSLPLGRDVAGLTRKYVTRHVGDTVPLVGTACGSPTGIPFAFTDPGREVALINPFDPAHDNGTLLDQRALRRRQDLPRQRAPRPLSGARDAARSCSTAPATTSSSAASSPARAI